MAPSSVLEDVSVPLLANVRPDAVGVANAPVPLPDSLAETTIMTSLLWYVVSDMLQVLELPEAQRALPSSTRVPPPLELGPFCQSACPTSASCMFEEIELFV